MPLQGLHGTTLTLMLASILKLILNTVVILKPGEHYCWWTESSIPGISSMMSLVTVETDMGCTQLTASVTTSRETVLTDVCFPLSKTRLHTLNVLFLKLFHCTTAVLPPLTAVGRYNLPAHVINVTGFQVDRKLVYVSFALAARAQARACHRRVGCDCLASREHGCTNGTACGHQHGFDASRVALFKHSCVHYFVLSPDAKYATQITHVKFIQHGSVGGGRVSKFHCYCNVHLHSLGVAHVPTWTTLCGTLGQLVTF